MQPVLDDQPPGTLLEKNQAQAPSKVDPGESHAPIPHRPAGSTVEGVYVEAGASGEGGFARTQHRAPEPSDALGFYAVELT